MERREKGPQVEERAPEGKGNDVISESPVCLLRMWEEATWNWTLKVVLRSMDVLLSAMGRRCHVLREVTWSGLFQNNDNKDKTIQNKRSCHFLDMYYVPDTLSTSSHLISPTNFHGHCYAPLPDIVEMPSFEGAQGHTDDAIKSRFKGWFPDPTVCIFQPLQKLLNADGEEAPCGLLALESPRSCYKNTDSQTPSSLVMPALPVWQGPPKGSF